MNKENRKPKPKINRLKYPLWSRIVFFVLTVIAPVVTLMVEGFQTTSKGYKITFGCICGLVVVWTFIHRFFLVQQEKKWRDRQVSLEHDYEIEVGNGEKIRYLWFNNELKLNIMRALNIASYGALIAVVISGVAEQLIAIKGALIIVIICYVVAYVLRFIVIAAKRGLEYVGGDDDENSGEGTE